MHADNEIAWTLVKPMMNNVLGIRHLLLFLIFPMSIIYLFFYLFFLFIFFYLFIFYLFICLFIYLFIYLFNHLFSIHVIHKSGKIYQIIL